MKSIARMFGHIRTWYNENYLCPVILISCLLSSLPLVVGATPFIFSCAAADSLRLKGKPSVIHYTKKEINFNSEFWAVCQDRDGIMYFGNKKGLIVFDGERWEKVKLPNNSSVRSLKISAAGVIYAAGYNEFGMVKKGATGKYYYESMTHLLRPEDRNFDNVWQIQEAQDNLIFRTHRVLIIIRNNKATLIPAAKKFVFSSAINDRYFIRDVDGGLKILNLETMEFTVLNLNFNDESVGFLLPGLNGNDFIAITKQGSVFKVDSALTKTTLIVRLIDQPSNNTIFSAIKSSAGSYYVGSISAPVISFSSRNGELVFDQNPPVLSDKTVLNLYETKDGNIWALQGDGIDYIENSSPVSILFEDASIYDVAIKENNVYLATNQGAFIAPLQTKKNESLAFKNIFGLPGLIWSVRSFNDQLLVGSDRGLYHVTGSTFKTIIEGPGFWKVIDIRNKPNQFLGCSYEGLYLINYDQKKGFELVRKIDGFPESCREILQADEPGTFWVCHGYKGVFKMKIDEAFQRIISREHFTNKNGLPNQFNINVQRWKNQIVFTTNSGIFTYDARENKFKPHEFLTRLFGNDHNVRKLLQYEDKTWFVDDDEVGYFITDQPNPILEKGLFLQLKGSLNEGLECIVPLSSNAVLIGTNMALYNFNLVNSKRPAFKLKTTITSVRFKKDSQEIYGPINLSPGKSFQIPSKINSLIFTFAAPTVTHKVDIQYSFKIEGIDDNWSDWQSSPEKEYGILPPGKYTFHVKAKSLVGEYPEEAVYYFEIIPLWYRSTWAIALYCVFIMAGVVCLIFWVRRKMNYERKKTINEEQQKRKLLELEIQRIKLEQENNEIKKNKDQLEEDVIRKSKELANYTMLLIKKRELLTDLQDQLKSLKDLSRNENSRQLLRESIRKINTNLSDEEHIRLFEINFERVHFEFFEELKSGFPDLTQKELNLCAFIRMNLSNKQIALIQNISVRGVETSRYRVRKKLNVGRDEDMVEFFERLYPLNGETKSNMENHDHTIKETAYHND
jgi:AraC family transcriptional regulator, chitin signaling transcriptional activator